MSRDIGVTASPPLCGPSGGAAKASPAKPAVANADPDCEYCFGTGSVATGGDEAHTAFSVACICTATEAELAAMRGGA